jgi:hypothetical protein
MKYVIGLSLLWIACSYALPPRLECEKKIGEIKIYGKTIKRYQLRGIHFSPRERYRLVVRWYNGEEAETLFYLADEKGHLLLEGENEPLYALCPLKRGERISFAMCSERDSGQCIATSVVPFPLQIKKKGLTLNFELLSMDGDRFFLQGEGFSPWEHVEFQCHTQEKVEKVETVADALGFIAVPIAFSMENGQWSRASLRVVRKNREISFPMAIGAPALEYVGGCCLEIR